MILLLRRVSPLSGAIRIGAVGGVVSRYISSRYLFEVLLPVEYLPIICLIPSEDVLSAMPVFNVVFKLPFLLVMFPVRVKLLADVLRRYHVTDHTFV